MAGFERGLTRHGGQMGSEGVPGRDPPVRAEVVHESGRTRVSRLLLAAGGTVVRKEPLGEDGERRARHEAAVLERLRGVAGGGGLGARRREAAVRERLRGVAGVAQLAQGPRYPGSVVLADAGGISLAGVAKPLAAG